MDLDIDSSILRTCWTSYREALAILYGENTFCFLDSFDIKYFRSEDLTKVQSGVTTPSKYNFGFVSGGVFQGRFLMVRKVAVRLTNHAFVDAMSFPERQSDQWRDIRREWSEFLLDYRSSSTGRVLLPALEELSLDFSDWMLEEKDRLQVS